MDLDPNFLRHGLIVFVLLFGSIVIHEWGHAYLAHLLGDDTPRAEGRLTLDPRAHFDAIGTFLVPLIWIFGLNSGALTYGWGRPVVTNPGAFRHRTRDDVLVSLAGPAANLLVALLATVLGCFLVPAQPRFAEIFNNLVLMNVFLAVINLIPIPPFDGGYILWRRLVGVPEETYLRMSFWSWPLLFLLSRSELWNRVLSTVFISLLEPYALISNLISPLAWKLIFHL